MTNSLGNACGELIEVFTELEDSLPEDVYKDLEPVITRVKDAALRSIVVEEQFDLLFRTFKVLSTNPKARLNRRMIELVEGRAIPADDLQVLYGAYQENPEPQHIPILPVAPAPDTAALQRADIAGRNSIRRQEFRNGPLVRIQVPEQNMQGRVGLYDEVLENPQPAEF